MKQGMEDILVSVIMPAYNCEDYIEQAICSALVQSVSLELIIIEDDSSDGTRECIQPFLEDERVIYVCNPYNMGVAASRNKGIQMAKGKYIAFLDADDRWTADKLERQLKLMRAKDAVLCCTARALMNQEGKLTGKVIPVKGKITYKNLLYSNCISMSSAVIKREAALEFPMEQDHLHEDYILWLTVLKKYGVAYGINEPMLEYRVSQGSKSGNKLKSAKMTFGVYRHIGLNIFQSIYYFIFYTIHGILKYI